MTSGSLVSGVDCLSEPTQDHTLNICHATSASLRSATTLRDAAARMVEASAGNLASMRAELAPCDDRSGRPPRLRRPSPCGAGRRERDLAEEVAGAQDGRRCSPSRITSTTPVDDDEELVGELTLLSQDLPGGHRDAGRSASSTRPAVSGGRCGRGESSLISSVLMCFLVVWVEGTAVLIPTCRPQPGDASRPPPAVAIGMQRTLRAASLRSLCVP